MINRTGISGRFDFHLEFAPEEGLPDSRDGAAPLEIAGPPIFTALQRQLGLKLEPAKCVGEFLVIDQVAKPAAN